MRQKAGPQTSVAEKTIKDIRRATRKHHSAEDKSVWCWKVFVAKTASLRSDVAKGLPRACIIAGRRNSSKQARSALPGTPPVRQPMTR